MTLNFRSIFYLFILPLGAGTESARYIGVRHIFSDASRANIVRVIFTDRGLGLLTSLVFAGVAWLTITNAAASSGIATVLFAMAVGSALAARITSLDTRKIFAASALSIVIHALTCTSVWLLCAGIGLQVDLWLVILAISACVFGAVILLALPSVQAGDFVAAGVLDL